MTVYFEKQLYFVVILRSGTCPWSTLGEHSRQLRFKSVLAFSLPLPTKPRQGRSFGECLWV